MGISFIPYHTAHLTARPQCLVILKALACCQCVIQVGVVKDDRKPAKAVPVPGGGHAALSDIQHAATAADHASAAVTQLQVITLDDRVDSTDIVCPTSPVS